MKTAFMFPGQGSQSLGMMVGLVEAFLEAREVFELASEAIDIDLLEIAKNGPESRINQTEITQPIVMTASLAMWRVWCAHSDHRPDYLCGHSLGEYTALVAAQVLDLQEAVSLVHLRGKLMQQAVPEGEGAMAALMGLEDARVEQLCLEAQQGQVVSAANYNAPGQVVISGAVAALERALVLAKEQGARRSTMLPISVPCHCEMLRPAGEELAAAIAALTIRAPTIPIVQNLDASIASSTTQLVDKLLKHLYSPVRWSQSIKALAGQGVGRFVECGPGKVLTSLNKRIDRSLVSQALNDQISMDSLQADLTGDS